MRNPYLSMLGTAWKYARNQRKLFLLVYGMFLIANIIVALNPLFYGWFINALQRDSTEVLTNGWIYVGGFLLLRLLEWCFHGPARVMERKLAFSLSRNFLDELYNKVLHLPVKWHQDNHSGSTISRIRKAYEALRDFFQNGFIYFYSFGKFFFSFGAMLYFSPLFGSLAVIIGLFTIFVIIKFDKPFLRSLKEVNEREHEVSSTLFDSLSNIISVITLRLESRIQKSFMTKVAEIFPPFKRNALINEWKWFTAQMMVGLIYCVITIGYVYQNWIPGEPFLIGGLVILLGYVNQFTSVFNDIAAQYTQIIKQHTELQNVSQIEETYAQRGIAHTEKLSKNWASIDIRDLNFTRADARSERSTGLKDINIRITKGQRIALIGESGSGKSTLLSVLRGLYTPHGNVKAILDNGTEIAFPSISNSVMLFPQDPEIFENTIRYNITLGLPFTEDEIMEACETARFTDVVKQLPQGLETHIKEKGVNLSGGQKQRLALARGILAARSNDIVLMDEPTSSVDPRTERLLYGNLFKTLQHKAVVSSLHRLHLLTQFDYVYILKNGEIVEAGTFEELKRRSLVFKELWDHQDEKFGSETPAHPDGSTVTLPISAAL